MRLIKLNTPVGEKEYPIHFSLNVVDDIQKRYKDISKLGEKLSDVSELKWIMARIINEGIKAQNYFNGTADRPVTEEQVGMMINFKEMNDGITDAIVAEFNEALGNEKNLTAEDLTRIYQQTIK